MKNNQMPAKEKDLQSCDTCEGPFEFLEMSPEHRLFRCRACKVVYILEDSASPGHDNATLSQPRLQVEPPSIYDETEHLQDLNTFDFAPNDKKAILEGEEKPISPLKYQ